MNLAATSLTPFDDLDFTRGIDLAASLEVTEHATETARAVAAPKSSGQWRDLTAELKTPAGTMVLRDLQSMSLCEARESKRGFLGFIGVGHGKTLLDFLMGTVLGAKYTLVLTKAGVVDQTIAAYAQLKAHWRLTPARVVSYNTLSRPEQSDSLTRLATLYGAGLVVVADECHELASPDSARTKRVGRLLRDFPGVRFVGLSGSMTDRSLWDYAHLAEWALGDCSPVPRTSEQRFDSHTEAWAQCVDPKGRPSSHHWDTAWPLLEKWGEPITCDDCDGLGCITCGHSGNGAMMLSGDARVAYAQGALGRRLADCRGVVLSRESSCDKPIEITVHRPEIPRPIRSLFERVEYDSERPDGEVLPDDLAKARVKSTLTMGYYQRWEWPEGKPDEEWLKARRRWNAFVRRALEESSRDGYDSPFLVWAQIGREVADGQRQAGHYAWMAWEEQRKKPSPPTAAVWVNGFWLADVKRLLASLTQPTLVWYQSRPVEAALQLLGLTTYGAGTKVPEHGRHTIAASIKVHGTGRNLQAWSSNVILEPPSSGKALEQLLGRTHRAGQDAEQITFAIYGHGAFGPVIETARKNAAYIERSTSNAQKALLAEWRDAQGAETRVES